VTEEYVLRNRAAWDRFAEGFIELGQRAWSSADAYWGIWGVPEREVGLLECVDGLDAVELSCGTGHVSSWLLRRGARPVGLDNSPNQLATARSFQEEFSISFPLVQGDAEHAPFPDESFYLVIVPRQSLHSGPIREP
jgi:SAM-dependent methyltransferase